MNPRAKVLDELSLDKNTVTKKAKVDGEEIGTIPDGVDSKHFYEIKDVQEQSLTKQLRAQMSAAKAEGKTVKLIAGDTTKISGPLQDAIDNKELELIRRPDLGRPAE